jgi:site-specific DNA recombinase
MKPFFGYIRVSTAKQGQQGVSLVEQRDAILRHAGKNGFEIVRWFEERETAAKRGRPVFNEMLTLLRQGVAQGVVLHKIDRGARNLKDWADLGDLIDSGIDIHFANEGLDLHSRGGRLSADIQAVVSADYIRNLKEESLKGFYGRLKQGVYPLPAPPGYLDKGKGKPKEPDPQTAPLVRKTFEMYATGRYTLETLAIEIGKIGLRNLKGARFTPDSLSRMLRNPFYIGLMHIKNRNETFPGAHPPLISKTVFDRVQSVISGKAKIYGQRHDFPFRCLFRCALCGYSLIGELQKGNHYYRCHTPDCPTTGIREELIEAEIQKQLSRLQFSEDEIALFRAKLADIKEAWGQKGEDEQKTIRLKIDQVQARLNRLTDAYLDAAIDRQVFEQRKIGLFLEKQELETSLARMSEAGGTTTEQLSQFLELAGNAWLSYETANSEEKRDLLKIVTSNREINRKNVVVKLSLPFAHIAERAFSPYGAPQRGTPRICDDLISRLTRLAEEGQLPDVSSIFSCRSQDISTNKNVNGCRFVIGASDRT